MASNRSKRMTYCRPIRRYRRLQVLCRVILTSYIS